MKAAKLLSCCIILFVLVGCDKDVGEDIDKEVVKDIEEMPTFTAGTYINQDIDKAKWGDFQLKLDIGKVLFSNDESIQIDFEFTNTGKIPINIGNFDYYSTIGTGPQIFVWYNENTCYEIYQPFEDINIADSIIIAPDLTKTLMSFNLKNTGGFIHKWSECCNYYSMTKAENFGTEIIPAEYKIYARFLPSRHIYESVTDTLTFTIE